MVVGVGGLAVCGAFFGGALYGRQGPAARRATPECTSRGGTTSEPDARPVITRVVQAPTPSGPAQPRDCPPADPADTSSLRPSDTLTAAADAFPDLLAHWDAGVAEGLFEGLDLERVQRQLAWMHDRVGDCGPPSPMGTGNESSARFAFVCERGVVEAGFGVSDPESDVITRMRTGVRDIAPPPEVTTAGSNYTNLIENWSADDFEAQFADSFREKLGEGMPGFSERLRDKLGKCSLGPVDLASATGALYVLDCEHGRRTMAVELNDENRIRALSIKPLRRDPSG